MSQRTCHSCGAASPEGAAYCPACGSPLGSGASPRDAGMSATSRPPAADPLTAPEAPPSHDSRNWALAAHLTALVGVFMGGLPAFLGPLVIWLLRRHADPFSADHAREALNFNLSVIVYVVVGAIAGTVVLVVTIGLAAVVLLPLALAAFVGYVVFTVIAAVAAVRGQPYRYPLSLTLVR